MANYTLGVDFYVFKINPTNGLSVFNFVLLSSVPMENGRFAQFYQIQFPSSVRHLMPVKLTNRAEYSLKCFNNNNVGDETANILV